MIGVATLGAGIFVAQRMFFRVIPARALFLRPQTVGGSAAG